MRHETLLKSTKQGLWQEGSLRKRKLASKFDMKDLGLMHYYWGLVVLQNPGEIFLGQGKYVVKIL